MSFFHHPEGVRALVFAGGQWTRDREFDDQCPGGGTSHVKVTAQYPLPAPPQDPITLLTGHGHQEQIGPLLRHLRFRRQVCAHRR